MKTILLLIIVLFPIHTFAYEFTLIDKTLCDSIINKDKYSICYSYVNNGPIFIEYLLDSSVNNVNIKKRPTFFIDPDIPVKYQKTKEFYYKSGYDRGHIASDASFDYDNGVLKSVYSYAAIVPQLPCVNRSKWLKVENKERKKALTCSIVVINSIYYTREMPVLFNKTIYCGSEKTEYFLKNECD